MRESGVVIVLLFFGWLLVTGVLVVTVIDTVSAREEKTAFPDQVHFTRDSVYAGIQERLRDSISVKIT